MKTLHELVDAWWANVCTHLNGAVLLLDDPSAECLHWHGGPQKALDSGAVAVKSFPPVERIESKHHKLVIIVSTLLSETTLGELMMVFEKTKIHNCTLISTLPATCQNIGRFEGEAVFSTIETQLKSWMNKPDSTAQVLYIPVFGYSIHPNIFMMPSFSKNFMPVISEFLLTDFLRKKDGGYHSFSVQMQKSIKELVNHVATLLDTLQMRADVFSLGSFAHIVGNELENLCQASKKKAPSKKASVLFIDRSLDLVGPLSHTIDTMYGKMLRVLPHLGDHVTDVCICMTDLTECNDDSYKGLPLLAPGCIGHRNNSVESDNLTTLLTSKFKESVMEVNRRFVQLSVKDGIAVDTTGGNASKILKNGLQSYKGNSPLLNKHCGMLQQVTGVVQTFDHPLTGHLDELLATEKLLIQKFSMFGPGVYEDLHRLITTHKERDYNLAEVLTFISLLYLLSDAEVLQKNSESSIQASILEALSEEDSSDLLSMLVGEDPYDEDVLSAVKTLFNILHELRSLRQSYKKYSSIFTSGDVALPATYVPLLKQIIENIYSSTDMPDVEFHSAGLKEYIKTGFSLFMNVGKPQPKDNPFIFIIVLGGITASEIKMIHDLCKRHQNPKIVIGTNCILTPDYVMDNLLFSVKEMVTSDEGSEDFD